MSTGKDVVMDGGKVGGALLELAGADSEEFFSQEWLGEVGNEEGSLYDVKRKNGLHTVHHVEGGVAGRLASSGTIGPKCEGCDHRPSGFVTFTCLDDGFTDRAVLSFDDAIGLGVVR